MNAKHILFALCIAFILYSAFKKTDAVQSIDFQGESYELSDTLRSSGSTVHMYTPGGTNFARAGKYLQVVSMPEVDMPSDEFRRQYTEIVKKSDSYKKLSENAFFYVEGNTAVYSTLVQEGDIFKLYGYAVIQSEEDQRKPDSMVEKALIASALERTVRFLPPPPASISTWF